MSDEKRLGGGEVDGDDDDDELVNGREKKERERERVALRPAARKNTQYTVERQGKETRWKKKQEEEDFNKFHRRSKVPPLLLLLLLLPRGTFFHSFRAHISRE